MPLRKCQRPFVSLLCFDLLLVVCGNVCVGFVERDYLLSFCLRKYLWEFVNLLNNLEFILWHNSTRLSTQLSKTFAWSHKKSAYTLDLLLNKEINHQQYTFCHLIFLTRLKSVWKFVQVDLFIDSFLKNKQFAKPNNLHLVKKNDLNKYIEIILYFI